MSAQYEKVLEKTGKKLLGVAVDIGADLLVTKIAAAIAPATDFVAARISQALTEGVDTNTQLAESVHSYFTKRTRALALTSGAEDTAARATARANALALQERVMASSADFTDFVEWVGGTTQRAVGLGMGGVSSAQKSLGNYNSSTQMKGGSNYGAAPVKRLGVGQGEDNPFSKGQKTVGLIMKLANPVLQGVSIPLVSFKVQTVVNNLIKEYKAEARCSVNDGKLAEENKQYSARSVDKPVQMSAADAATSREQQQQQVEREAQARAEAGFAAPVKAVQ